MMKKLGLDMPEEKLDYFMSIIDKDGDGTIDYHEFVAFLTGKIKLD